MKQQDQYDSLVKQYYEIIFRYSKTRLQNDHFAAEECTQDVFMLLYRKINKLNLEDNIKGWLYASADRIIRNYLKRNRKRIEMESVPLDSVYDLPVAESEDHSEYFQALSDSEFDLLKRYYSSDTQERYMLAQQLGISMDALYQRIRTIKKKVKFDK